MKILINDDKISIISKFNIQDKLPLGYYSLRNDAFGNVFLSIISEPVLPIKIYNQNSFKRNLIINSFNKSINGIGVLLKGSKGTGKTVDAKLLCKELNLPVIMIDSSIPNNVRFTDFLNSIEQEFVLFIDEFDKHFLHPDERDDQKNNHDQNAFLSLLDGTGSKFKKFFIFTSNSLVSDFLVNRPSRIKYLINYIGIEEDLAKTIILDLLENKEFGEDLINNIDLKSLTIDILISIIKEINIHKIPYSEFKEMFNYNYECSDVTVYESFDGGDNYVILQDNEIRSSLLGSHAFINNDVHFFFLKKDKNGYYYYASKKNENNVLKIIKVRKTINIHF